MWEKHFREPPVGRFVAYLWQNPRLLSILIGFGRQAISKYGSVIK